MPPTMKDNSSTQHTLDFKSLNEADVLKFNYFDQFPISKQTLKALKSNGFTKPTDIQKLVLKHALQGKDVVAEAVTGSGKTIAFLVPVLERLFANKVSCLDGPVAIILTPTREITRQVFGVLKKICQFHRFTIMNIMGGKPNALQKHEWNSVSRANILVGTPGRLAQHQTENPLLDTSNLQMLVLDEADRLLDSTFRRDLELILENLTPTRQTMLFSATQTKATDQLIHLSMTNPVIVSTNDNMGSIPAELIQSYAIVPLTQKLDILWTFLQSHCKKKIIVFFSTQKQVRYTYEIFQLLRPYFRIMQLRGNMLQQKRFQVYDRFSMAPQGAVLFATNVAERGLDFPAVDWVVQFDCPHHVDDYIHRVGRTARFGRIGRSILFLAPSEQRMIELLEKRGIALRPQKFPDSKISTMVSKSVSSILVRKPELAEAARSAFSAYLRDYCLAARARTKSDSSSSSSSVFDPTTISLLEFANSLGLVSIPDLPREYLKLVPDAKKLTVSAFELNESSANIAQDDDNDESDEFLMKKSTRRTFVSDQGLKRLDMVEDSSSSDDQGDKPAAPAPEELSKSKKKSLTKIQRAKKELKRKVRGHQKIEFGDDGQVITKKIGDIPVSEDLTAQSAGVRLDLEKERELLHNVIDKKDKLLWKQRLQERNRSQKHKLKQARRQMQQEHQPKAVLASDASEEEEGEQEADSS